MAPICLQAPIKHVFVHVCVCVCVYEKQQDPSVWVSKHHFCFLTFNDPSFRAMQKEFKLLAAIPIFYSLSISVFPPYCFSILSWGKSCLALPVNPAHEIHFLAFPSLKGESILKSAYVLLFSPLIHIPTVSETTSSV